MTNSPRNDDANSEVEVYIGLLPEQVVWKNIRKLQRLIHHYTTFKNTPPKNTVEEVSRSVQLKAIRHEYMETIFYLRRWKVNIKGLIKHDSD